MPLLDTNQRINSTLADLARNVAAHNSAAASAANRMVSELLQLDDETLSGWLNSQPQEELLALFAAHEVLGTRINEAADTAAAVLTASGIDVTAIRADVRPFAEKLADQNRELTIDQATRVMSVVTIDPATEPA